MSGGNANKAIGMRETFLISMGKSTSIKRYDDPKLLFKRRNRQHGKGKWEKVRRKSSSFVARFRRNFSTSTIFINLGCEIKSLLFFSLSGLFYFDFFSASGTKRRLFGRHPEKFPRRVIALGVRRALCAGVAPIRRRGARRRLTAHFAKNHHVLVELCLFGVRFSFQPFFLGLCWCCFGQRSAERENKKKEIAFFFGHRFSSRPLLLFGLFSTLF